MPHWQLKPETQPSHSGKFQPPSHRIPFQRSFGRSSNLYFALVGTEASEATGFGRMQSALCIIGPILVEASNQLDEILSDPMLDIKRSMVGAGGGSRMDEG